MENKKTPEMRFKGFTEDWEQRKLGEISEKVTEKNKNNKYSETLTNSAEFGIINQRDFFDKDISNEKNLNGYFVVQPDDFVYNPRISKFAPVGPIKRNKLGRTGVMSPLYYVFRTNNIDKNYLENYFSGSNWHRFMKLNGDSGARSDRFSISGSLFQEMPIPFPSIEEQNKIGDFLNKLDDTIVLHQQELDTLKQTKQGFLQKMFPKEGESVPEIRFPGFTGEWEEQKLEELIEKGGSGGTPKSTNKSYYDGDIPFLAISDISNSSGYIDNTEKFISESGLENSAAWLVPKGAISLAMYASVGKLAILNIEVATSQAFYNMVFEDDSLRDFVYHRLYKANVSGEWTSLISTGTQANLNAKKIRSFMIRLPNDKEEISEIGSFFKKIDKTILFHQQELETLKQTKKAFLQKMFV